MKRGSGRWSWPMPSIWRLTGRTYGDLERQLIFELSRILPRMTSEPDGLVVVAGTFNRTTSATLVATRAAEVWLQGQLTDEEFEDTWRRQVVEAS